MPQRDKRPTLRCTERRPRSRDNRAPLRCPRHGLMEVCGFLSSRIDACLPETIVAFCDWLVRASGWKVRDPEDPSTLVPLASRHICLLFRRFTNYGKDITRDYVRELEARDIPHLLAGSKSFHSREEVETLRAAPYRD